MLTFGEYTNSTTHLLTRRNKTSICLSNDYWFDLLEIDNDGFISSIQWSRHGTTNALHLLSIQTLLLPSPLNFTTNTGYANHSPTFLFVVAGVFLYQVGILLFRFALFGVGFIWNKGSHSTHGSSVPLLLLYYLTIFLIHHVLSSYSEYYIRNQW